jgi:type I restriction enzyme S subunit
MWKTVKLGDAIEIARGGSPRPIKSFITTEDDGVNWIKIGDTEKGGRYIYTTKEKIKPSGVSRSRHVKENDFLLSNSMSFGRPYILKTSGCIHDGWLVLSEYQELFSADYLYYLLSSSLVQNQFERLARGSTVRNLNIELVSQVTVPLPPLAEQQRIVAKLDAAFAEIDGAIEVTDKETSEANNLFDSALGSQITNQAFPKEKIQAVCTIGDGNHSSNYPKKTEMVQQGVPFLRAGNVQNGTVVDGDLKFISDEKHQKLKKGHLQQGDVLITNRGEIGKTAIVPKAFHGANLNSQVAWLRPNENLLSEFLFYALNTRVARQAFGLQQTGAALQQLTIKQLKVFEIPLPSLAQQQRIVESLSEISSHVTKMRQIWLEKREHLQALKAAILAQELQSEAA